MKTFRFDTTTTMKEYNCKKWWIDGGIVLPITIAAETLSDALEKYRESVERYGVTVSKNALANKNAMYQDTASGTAVQCGYVITGAAEFEDQRHGWRFVKQYIDLWVNISIVANPFAEVSA